MIEYEEEKANEMNIISGLQKGLLRKRSETHLHKLNWIESEEPLNIYP